MIIEAKYYELFRLLIGAWPDTVQRWSSESLRVTIEVYRMALDDLDSGRLLEAVIELIKTSRTFPTIAEIRDKVAALKGAPT